MKMTLHLTVTMTVHQDQLVGARGVVSITIDGVLVFMVGIIVNHMYIMDAVLLLPLRRAECIVVIIFIQLRG